MSMRTSKRTSNFKNEESPDGDQKMPSASIQPEVRVPQIPTQKVWILVQSIYFQIVNRIWNSYSGDTAGRFVTQFCQADLKNTEDIPEIYRRSGMTRQFKRVNVHDISKKWLFSIGVSISASTGPFHESHVLPYIEDNPQSSFIGPAYPKKSQSTKISDTQLCVSGTVEKYDASPRATAIREIREEIGVNIQVIKMEKIEEHVDEKGQIHHLFFATI